MEVGNWLEEFTSSTKTTAGSMKYEDPYNYYSEEGGGASYLPSLEDKMPFLQMLQTVEQHHQQQQPLIHHFEPTNFQFLLRLQHQLVESCVTTTTNHHFHNNHGNYVGGNDINNNDGMIIMDIQHSPGVKSETTEIGEKVEKCNGRSTKKTQFVKTCTTAPAAAPVKEKRKRKRATRPAKNKQEVETQRMTHIAVERNRRRQMNEHLNALRSLMPPSYVQRGDQASIIGGAIDFVKELEQMLQSLQAQKKMRQTEENGDVSVSPSSSNLNNLSINSNMFMASPSFHSLEDGKGNGESGEGSIRKSNEEFSAEKKTGIAEIEVVVIQNHVNLKIKCQRRQGQLIKAIVAFEELRLTVLHLNITSLHTLVHYSFNLKIEDDCKLGTADDVARAVHQIFSLINLS
ncbi:transcription factor bHLH57-like isoform X2 [Chenopodium quinoa]|nr:transcription factor bHLH57-like isoform X2 [Chenopodium quinoa]XP_021767230.1 transcription factor bHLH57-like isoform X2 [Chenopodium quinoa]